MKEVKPRGDVGQEERGVELEDGVIGVLVDDKAGEVVGFGVAEAEGVGVRFVGDDDGFAEGDRGVESVGEEGCVERLVGVVGVDADGKVGSGSGEASADPLLLTGEDVDGVAGLWGAGPTRDGAGKDPGMALPEEPFAAGFEGGMNGSHGGDVFRGSGVRVR